MKRSQLIAKLNAIIVLDDADPEVVFAHPDSGWGNVITDVAAQDHVFSAQDTSCKKIVLSTS